MVPILIGEVHQYYRQLLSGVSVDVGANRRYHDYIEWVTRQDPIEAKDFWKKHLSGIDTPTSLGIEKPGRNLSIHQGEREIKEKIFYFPKALTEALMEFSQKTCITLNTLMQGVYARVLSQYSGQRSIIFGVVVSGRTIDLAGVDQMVGLLISTIPLRVDVDGDTSGIDQLKRLQSVMREAEHYGYLSLPEVQAVSEITRDQPLFYSLYVFENYPTNNNTEISPGLQMSDVAGQEKTNYPLSISIGPGEQLIIKIAYDPSCFTDSSIDSMSVHFQSVAQTITREPTKPLASIDLLNTTEYNEILHVWNRTERDYPKDKTIHQLFEEQVNRTPHNIAVVFEEQKLTYQELNERANQVSAVIRSRYQRRHQRTLPPDTLIGLCINRSIEMVIGILAILKAGGAYVPLDPNYPLDRLEYMLSDTATDLLLSQREQLSQLISYTGESICFDRDEEEIRQASTVTQGSQVTANSLAYIIYTSGSTGKPKGVMIEHQGVNNYCGWFAHEYECFCNSTIDFSSSLSFDLSVSCTLSPLMHGACIAICPEKRRVDPRMYVSYLVDNKVTHVSLTPGYLSQLLTGENVVNTLVDLKWVILGAEALSADDIRQWLTIQPAHMIVNEYGPTEATVAQIAYKVEKTALEQQKSIPIGKPGFNMTAYILDCHQHPVPIGVRGELYIGGDGVARGYLNREELTREKFIPNPFLTQEEQVQGKNARLYRTGDLVRWLPDGNIDFIGRIDDQVKIRGFRIECGEIEAALTEHELIDQACVIAQEGATGKQLVAYYVLKHDNKTGTEKPHELPVDQLRQHLGRTLPGYMIPSFFMKLGALPLNSSGKVDRRSLPSPSEAAIVLENAYVAPRNELERKLVQIWKEVLHQEHIGIHDNFFSLGGHSLLMMSLANKIRNHLGASIALSEFYRFKTVEEQASVCVRTSLQRSADSLLPIQTNGKLVPLFLVHPGGGTAFPYLALAKYFEIQPIYGVNNPRFLHPENPFDSVESMASEYIEQIKAIQHYGPYYIGGWSYGGTVALEMAKQLQARQNEVSLIILIDTIHLPGSNPAITLMFEKHAEQHLVQTLKEPDPHIKQCMVAESLNTERLLQKYNYAVYEGLVVLLKAKEKNVDLDFLEQIDKSVYVELQRQMDDPCNGWKTICKNLKVFPVPGNHNELFDSGNVGEVADAIQQAITLARERNKL